MVRLRAPRWCSTVRVEALAWNGGIASTADQSAWAIAAADIRSAARICARISRRRYRRRM